MLNVERGIAEASLLIISDFGLESAEDPIMHLV